MQYRYLLIAIFFGFCASAHAEWFLRGTHNAWAATPMDSAGAGTNTMQVKGVIFTAAGSFKIDRFGNWSESYGVGGLSGSNIPVAAGTWDIKFFTDSKTWNVSTAASSAASIYHVRGSFNGWAEGTLMSRIGATDNYERCVNFIGSDASGGPRFKIDPNGGWGSDAVPAADFSVNAGWVKINFNSFSKAISVQQNLPANCVSSSSSSSSSSASSVVSSSVTSSSVVNPNSPSSIYHVRGTFNGWAQGSLMSRIGTTADYELCANFVAGDANGGPRFKIDPNGGWGNDAVPAADFSVTAGWIKIIFNSTSKAISVQQNLSANCSSNIVPTMSLSLTNNGGRAYRNLTANLIANVSAGTGWQYQWKLMEDETYNRKDIYDLTWNSQWGGDEYKDCQLESIGQRVSGKLYPPVSGMYKFAVAADDMHQLFLTINGTKQLLTSSTQAVTSSDFSKTSQLIMLNAANPYAFEFLYINKSGAGHFSILWQKPGSNQWEEVPENVFSKAEETAPTGVLLQETFNQSLTSFDQLTNLSSFINSRSNAAVTTFTGSSLNFTPPQNKTYTFDVTATSGTTVLKDKISFYAEGRLVSEIGENAEGGWKKENISNNAVMQSTSVNDGTATQNVLEITAPAGGSTAEFKQVIYLKPYTAYEVRARVRLLNAPSNIEIPRSATDNHRLWKLPRLRVGVHGDSSQQGIDATNPGQWRDVVVDFIVPYHGAVDLHLQMGGAYSGTFQIDNIRIQKLSGNGVTQFEFSNMSANIYDEFVTKAGGYSVAKNYFSRMSRVAESMRKLSGKNFVVQCTRQNIFVPKHWSVNAFGTNMGTMILVSPEFYTDSFLQSVWKSDNRVEGVLIHEIEHSFDFPGSSFNAHLPILLQVYAMESDSLLRTESNGFVNVQEWIAQERAIKPSTCTRDATALLPKFFQFQDVYLSSDKWSVFKQIMHDRWSPYKTEVEGRAWPSDYYGQYIKWWTELQSYTGLDAWNLMHTPTEQSNIQVMLQRMQNALQASIDPATLPASEKVLYLNKAIRSSTSIGYGDIDINDLVPINNQCYLNNIYAHAPSSISYQLNKKWQTFNTQAVIKVNSAVGRVVARVLGDGVELYRSASFTAASSPVNSGSLNVSNVNVLTLEFLADGDNNSDWSVWIDPQLTRN